MPHFCHHCAKEVQISDRVGRGDTCPFCNADAHCCQNCSFYDTAAYNECREPSADVVKEKERANYCDFFRPRSGSGKIDDKAAALKAAAEALFKKSN